MCYTSIVSTGWADPCELLTTHYLRAFLCFSVIQDQEKARAAACLLCLFTERSYEIWLKN